MENEFQHRRDRSQSDFESPGHPFLEITHDSRRDPCPAVVLVVPGVDVVVSAERNGKLVTVAGVSKEDKSAERHEGIPDVSVVPEVGVIASDPLRAPKQAKSVLTLDAIRLSQELPKVVRESVPELGFARLDSVR